MTSLLKNLLIFLAIIATGAIGYYLYTQGNDPSAKASNDAINASITLQTESFLKSLNELKTISLDGSIFSDPRFNSLTSYTSPVQAQAIGRPDPFDVNR